ncbi:uncharacterized protein RJT21DRAFT_58016 [Scheffersomyces amazonensis]|uniref:uncharacterized protein n=1 Tax=Scheffersomyces amazonensis TaxID=1078765 RepID=UPI00315CB0A2
MTDHSESETTPGNTPVPDKQRTPALFLDEPDKTDEAKLSFVEIPECTYSNKLVGSSGQKEYMTCDCTEQWDPETQQNLACGDDSNCINRFTSVECVNGDCDCGDNCQNQRFQKKEYASVSVFQTELKGYGLRANTSINESTFIYEYIGEVIDEPAFRKRMLDYDAKNFKHFYFMMLKNDSFIDATVKGSLARFVNHSCNPNAYVDKWVVGGKLRMGIFAKRLIQQGEEITFDYNVDRYGAQSQPCYCGEPNCIKFMGGKTQTDAALLLPEGIAEALGVTPQQERKWLKENKALRSKQQSDDTAINEKFIKELIIQPLQEIEVSKVMGALMKSQDFTIVNKLIQRINSSREENINLAIIRFHGYKTFSTIIQQFKNSGSNSLMIMILEILNRWPKLYRNKISSSQIEDVIKDIQQTTDNIIIRKLSTKLLDEWSKLEMAYRIPKSNGGNGVVTDLSSYGRSTRTPETEQQQYNQQENVEEKVEESQEDGDLPPGWESALDPGTQKIYYYHRELQKSSWERPVATPPIAPKGLTPKPRQTNVNTGPSRDTFREELANEQEEKLKRQREEAYRKLKARQDQLKAVIEQTRREEEERREAELKEKQRLLKERLAAKKKELKKRTSISSSPSSASPSSNGSRNHHHHHHHHHSNHGGDQHPKVSSSSDATESKWRHLFASHVPNLIKKKAGDLPKDEIKGCAKDIAANLASKEIKKDPKGKVPSELDKHKLKKIKEFVDAYMEKFLTRYNAKHNKRSHEGSDQNGEDEGGDSKRTKA